MSLKKKSTAVKTGAVSMIKKALTLEKLFQSLSQKKCDALLHMSDREEKMSEKTSEERTGENEMKENNEDEELEFQIDKLSTLSTYLFIYEVIKDQDKEKTVIFHHYSARLHDAAAEESTDESYNRSLKSQEESKTVTQKLIILFTHLKKS
ncbi:uncharacterized protein BDCG_16309 [Blastomyces dermatitidis ER-3]|uniref:Uncharacterized protein n=1 Tax=Ajellomyces dermatitidis (strain ER-3 / ATCC MYA-2586) TaxID=559297 RepID=A0ABX2VRB8_AJEDR|nr:uncharacterized protein BDCG_16309 [Blastomyces dermatitidis ER-3]OAS99785.1 hypothetical protein BDCG_16309 [Blastomyces dermatitidis ER-3]